MEREELLRNREYWITQIQMSLFEVINNYLKESNLTRTQFAEQLGVNKSYVSQILSGNFDHKISKYVDLLLACQKIPIIKTMDLKDYTEADAARLDRDARTIKRITPKKKVKKATVVSEITTRKTA